MSVTVITVDGKPVNLVALPSYPGLAAVEFTGFDGIGYVPTPFAGGSQVQQWQGGDMWSGKATMPMMVQKPNADNWLAFLEELRGMNNAFQMGDPLQPDIRGSGAGRPRVDNNAAGNNAPGSLTLSTRGWTPNLPGVLLAGDYIQLGYRLYRCLDDVTPDADGNAVFSIWPCLREQPFDDGTPGGWVNGNGIAHTFTSSGLSDHNNGIRWYNFQLITKLPGDAVITGIYPVLVCSAVKDRAFSYYSYGSNGTFGWVDNTVGPSALTLFTQPMDPANTSFASTVFYDTGVPSLGGTGIGTSLSLLPPQAIQVMMDASLFQQGMADAINVTAVGYAVYYTSATPTTDDQMPAPFTVPTGSGVGWALPFSVLKTITNTGSAVATPAVNNGLLTLYNTKGIWRLATNKRDWTTESNRLTAPVFPFQEYR